MQDPPTSCSWVLCTVKSKSVSVNGHERKICWFKKQIRSAVCTRRSWAVTCPKHRICRLPEVRLVRWEGNNLNVTVIPHREQEKATSHRTSTGSDPGHKEPPNEGFRIRPVSSQAIRSKAEHSLEETAKRLKAIEVKRLGRYIVI